ncbi:MATE family efflux transporter [Roseibium salinum]|nr:MATE family efflux transporter [Roseibium salinum]
MAFGAVLTLLQILCDFIAISEGNTRFSMWTLLSGFSLNIVLDPILILWTGFGVAGAALATIISRVAVLVVYALYFRRRVGRLRVGPGLVRPIRSLLVPVFAIGLPTTLTSLVTGAAFALVYAMAAELGGDDAVAAIGIAMRILLLGTLPLIGFVLGAQAVLSFAYGRRDFARLSEATRFMAAATFGAAVVYGLGIAAFADQVAGFFYRRSACARARGRRAGRHSSGVSVHRAAPRAAGLPAGNGPAPACRDGQPCAAGVPPHSCAFAAAGLVRP